MKKKVILVGALLLLTLVLAACGYGGTATTSSWSNTNLAHSSQTDSWSISATSINGHSQRRLDLTADELANIHVSNSSSAGVVNIVLIQGDLEQVFNVEGQFSGTLDTSAFEAGRIRMRAVFANARDVDLSINWAR